MWPQHVLRTANRADMNGPHHMRLHIDGCFASRHCCARELICDRLVIGSPSQSKWSQLNPPDSYLTRPQGEEEQKNRASEPKDKKETIDRTGSNVVVQAITSFEAGDGPTTEPSCDVTLGVVVLRRLFLFVCVCIQ